MFESFVKNRYAVLWFKSVDRSFDYLSNEPEINLSSFER